MNNNIVHSSVENLNSIDVGLDLNVFEKKKLRLFCVHGSYPLSQTIHTFISPNRFMYTAHSSVVFAFYGSKSYAIRPFPTRDL